ncbi:MAG: hypothetical protein RBU30_10155 [Polyangia bacterium]|jgi:hypothetical protein|nr:hypothetical protein [Polyangia bacterium]
MKRNRILLPVLAVAGLFALAMGCSDDDSPGNNNNQVQVCNNDGVCDTADGENAVNCAADCVVTCTLSGISGTAHDFLVSELYIPDSSTTAKENGVDLNGDGVIDNKLGSIISLIASQGGDFDVNESVNAEIQEGSLLLIGRVVVDQFVNDDQVLAQVLQAVVVGGATPIFDGNDEVALNPDAPDDLFLCGRIVNNVLEAGPSNLAIVFPIAEIGTLDITLERAQLIGQVTEAGMVDVMLGGGLSKEEIETNLYPTVLEYLNGEIEADPTGSMATIVLDLLDDNCEPTLPGCDPAPAGCAEDQEIHVDELKCNALLNSALAPDVDIDGDGTKDLISLGLKIVSAVPVTVVTQ